MRDLEPRCAGSVATSASTPGRADPPRHQEARPLRAHRPPHHRRAHRQQHSRAAAAGSSSTSASTTLRAWPSARSCPTRTRKAPSPSSGPPWPTYASLGVTVDRVMTDNGSCYRSKAFRKACARARPQAHLHQALHAEDQRQGRALHPDRPARMGLRPGLPQLGSPTAELPIWLHRYNWHRPHGGIKSRHQSAVSA